MGGTCLACGKQTPGPNRISFAFQPIVDLAVARVTAYEALLRGAHGEGAHEVYRQIPSGRLQAFDAWCRSSVIREIASRRVIHTLHVNVIPSALASHEYGLESTFVAAERHGVSLGQLVFEITEHEQFDHRRSLAESIGRHRHRGFRTALDDFGAGYSGLSLLAGHQPDFIKIDRGLVTNIHHDRVKQAIVGGLIQIAQDVSIAVIGEGVEQQMELAWLYEHGVRLFQGYYFAKPGFEKFPSVPEDRLQPPGADVLSI